MDGHDTLTLALSGPLKSGLEKAAAHRQDTASSLGESIIREWLEQHNHLRRPTDEGIAACDLTSENDD